MMPAQVQPYFPVFRQRIGGAAADVDAQVVQGSGGIHDRAAIIAGVLMERIQSKTKNPVRGEFPDRLERIFGIRRELPETYLVAVLTGRHVFHGMFPVVPNFKAKGKRVLKLEINSYGSGERGF